MYNARVTQEVYILHQVYILHSYSNHINILFILSLLIINFSKKISFDLFVIVKCKSVDILK